MKNLKVRFYALFAFLLVSQITIAQSNFCNTPHPRDSQLLNRSTTCDVDLDEISTKTIRVTVHVFQKNDGSGNIPNTSTGRAYVSNLVKKGASDKMTGLDAMNLSTSSPHITDSK